MRVYALSMWCVLVLIRRLLVLEHLDEKRRKNIRTWHMRMYILSKCFFATSGTKSYMFSNIDVTKHIHSPNFPICDFLNSRFMYDTESFLEPL